MNIALGSSPASYPMDTGQISLLVGVSYFR
jgi:hypothetical protein